MDGFIKDLWGEIKDVMCRNKKNNIFFLLLKCTVQKEEKRSLTIWCLQSFMNEISCRLEVNIQIKVCRVICWNATIHKAVAIKALVPYAALLGVSSV